jgi:hypothetical protein
MKAVDCEPAINLTDFRGLAASKILMADGTFSLVHQLRLNRIEMRIFNGPATVTLLGTITSSHLHFR